MNDWQAGYTAETNYTFGYYTELNPLRAQFLLLCSGIKPPEVTTACELGFGQGVTVNIHAAASGAQWYGNDFNPAQTVFARELAEAAGAGAALSEESFEQFCQRGDLPEFDYIGLHGIWSWISPENQHVIVDFLSRKLKAGGVLYISYNTPAGWATMAPIRELLVQHNRTMSAPGQDRLSRVRHAMAFVEQMMALKPRYLQANPTVTQRLAQFAALDTNYLAHEFFNTYWAPVAFSTIAPVLKLAKLEFAGPAPFVEHVHALNLTPEQIELLSGISDTTFRQLTRDFLLNQQFRQDYWIKGARRLSVHEQQAALRALRVMLVMPLSQISMTVTGALGEATMDVAVYEPLLAALAEQPIWSIGELAQRVAGAVTDLGSLLQLLLVLLHKNCVSLVQPDNVVSQARPQADRLNRHLLEQALGRDDLLALASPLTGGGVFVLHLQQLFLLARLRGLSSPEQWTQFAWQAYQSQQRVLVDGKGVALITEQENMTQIQQHAVQFQQQTLPILQLLGVTAE